MHRCQPNMLDNEGRIPMSCAASTGHGVVVKLFEGREIANPDTRVKESRAPLQHPRPNGPSDMIEPRQSLGLANPVRPKDNVLKPPASVVKREYHRVMEFLRRKRSPSSSVAYASGVRLIISVLVYFSSPFLFYNTGM
ncbi:hypothetical protein L873DRAFT_1874324 [Choiromyces venosus 120613-1]|uniref:Uncharacterized protein n=1 Tax=Choiromyces venosus 120613-1 TaxID=1336337 RepID=A0A3N4IYG7_9PEZI|nr:hypothetical protein L873DRAFT_1874324 [Choiromyces venosus 120613-1]